MDNGTALLISPDRPVLGTTDHSAEAVLIELTARERLEIHPHFRGRSSTVGVQFEQGILVLSGKLPSFYLKQLVQEALRGLNPQIQNNIDVISCNGLSTLYGLTPRLGQTEQAPG